LFDEGLAAIEMLRLNVGYILEHIIDLLLLSFLHGDEGLDVACVGVDLYGKGVTPCRRRACWYYCTSLAIWTKWREVEGWVNEVSLRRI
jgi:hypothetical protein